VAPTPSAATFAVPVRRDIEYVRLVARGSYERLARATDRLHHALVREFWRMANSVVAGPNRPRDRHRPRGPQNCRGCLLFAAIVMRLPVRR